MSPNNRIKHSPPHNFFACSVQYIRSFFIYVWMRFGFGTQMDSKEPEKIANEECEKTFVQPITRTTQEMESIDTVDFTVNDSMIQALEEVSGAIYKLCFSKWHCPPEEMMKQPLFKEINTAILGIFYNIKAKVRPLEEYEILIAVLNALIIHLKNFRKNPKTYRDYTPQEEADLLRKQTQNLLLYWLPSSLSDSNHIMVFLNEIISINVLRPSMSNLADPRFINETIVRTLGNEEAPQMKDFYETCSVFSAPCAIAPNAPITYTSDSIPNRKEKKKGFVKQLKGLVHRKKDKHTGHSSFRSYQRTTEEDTIDNIDDNTSTEMNIESSKDDPVRSVCDSVLQKWLQENWTANICENPTQDRPTYKICVSKEDPLNTKLWITERSVKDFRQIYSFMCQAYPDLKIFTSLEEIEEADIYEDSQFFQAIRINPDTFLNKLLGLIEPHQNQELVFFFSPFNYEEEEREVFFKTFSEDEDSSAVESEMAEEFNERADDPKGCYESDGYRLFQKKNKKITSKTSKDGSGSELEDTSIHDMSDILCSSADPAPPMLEKDTAHHKFRRKKHKFKERQKYTTKSSTDPSSVSTDEPNVNYLKVSELTAVPYLRQEEENKKQRKELEGTLLNALYRLADELFAGGESRFRFLHNAGILKDKSKAILDAIPKLYEEEKIIWYLNQTSELLLVDVCPLDVSPDKLPSMAQEILKSKLQGLLTNKVIKFFFEKNILKNITASHEAFQNLKANKETLFRILEDLTRIITNGSQETRRY